LVFASSLLNISVAVFCVTRAVGSKGLAGSTIRVVMTFTLKTMQAILKQRDRCLSVQISVYH